jgi:hypothetical protein
MRRTPARTSETKAAKAGNNASKSAVSAPEQKVLDELASAFPEIRAIPPQSLIRGRSFYCQQRFTLNVPRADMVNLTEPSVQHFALRILDDCHATRKHL